MKSPRRMAVTAAVSIILSGLAAQAGDASRRNLSRRSYASGDGVKSFLTDEEDRHSGSSQPSRKHRVSSHHKTRSHPEDQDEQDGQDEDSTTAGKRSTSSKHPKATPTPTPEPEPSPTPSPRSRTSSTPAGGENTEDAKPGPTPIPAQVSSLPPEALKEYASQPSKVQELLRESLALTEKNLAYAYGSSDPVNGGMDCSGFIYYVLQRIGFRDVPRDSSEQYLWVRKISDFHAVLSRRQDTFELDELRPGDLLFWSGTYGINRDVPITHVMIYLGKDKKSGKQLMVGASDGRTYNGVQRYGVSVFDFTLPNGQPSKNDPARTPRFDGYATIPGLRPSNLARNNQAQPQTAQPVATPAPSPSPSPSSPTHHHKRRSHGD